MPPQYDIYPLRDPTPYAFTQTPIWMGGPHPLWSPTPQLIDSWRTATSYPNYATVFMQGYPQPPPLPRLSQVAALRNASNYTRLGYTTMLMRDNGTVIGTTPETTPYYAPAGPIQFDGMGPVMPIAEIDQFQPMQRPASVVVNNLAPVNTPGVPLPAPFPNPARALNPWTAPGPYPALAQRFTPYVVGNTPVHADFMGGASPYQAYGMPYYFASPPQGPPGYQRFGEGVDGFPLYSYRLRRPPQSLPPFVIETPVADANPAPNPAPLAATADAARRFAGIVGGAFAGASLPLLATGVGAGILVGALEYRRATADRQPPPREPVTLQLSPAAIAGASFPPQSNPCGGFYVPCRVDPWGCCPLPPRMLQLPYEEPRAPNPCAAGYVRCKAGDTWQCCPRPSWATPTTTTARRSSARHLAMNPVTTSASSSRRDPRDVLPSPFVLRGAGRR